MSKPTSRPILSSIHALQLLLIMLSLLVIVAGYTAAAPYTHTSREFFAAYLLGGLLLAVLLWSLVGVLHLLAVQTQQNHHQNAQLEQLQQNLKALNAQLITLSQPPEAPVFPIIPPPLATPTPHPTVAERNLNQASGFGMSPDLAVNPEQQMLDVLKQLRDLMMMNEGQRSQFAHHHFGKRKEGLLKQIDRAIATSHWQTAEEQIRELQRILPDDPIGPELAARVAEEKTTRLHQDIEAARIQLRHLMSITAWTQAEELVAGLHQRYPTAIEVQELGTEVRQEKLAFEQEHLQRLILDLKDATDHRQWRHAVTLAEELIRRYPSEKQVERLRVDLPTLQENAEAQDRKEQEAQFKDLLHRQRYEEALAIAHQLIAKYPNSSAAAELSKLTPKVQELIAQEKLKHHPSSI